jgi:hypothetical protein
MSLSDRERAGGFQGGHSHVDGVDISSSVGSGGGMTTTPLFTHSELFRAWGQRRSTSRSHHTAPILNGGSRGSSSGRHSSYRYWAWQASPQDKGPASTASPNTVGWDRARLRQARWNLAGKGQPARDKHTAEPTARAVSWRPRASVPTRCRWRAIGGGRAPPVSGRFPCGRSSARDLDARGRSRRRRRGRRRASRIRQRAVDVGPDPLSSSDLAIGCGHSDHTGAVRHR